MRIFHILPAGSVEVMTVWPETLPAEGYFWITAPRSVFQAQAQTIQAQLHRLFALDLLDPYLVNLCQAKLGSRFDDTPAYDVMVFQQLAQAIPSMADDRAQAASMPGVQPVQTAAAGFVLGDRVLLSVLPDHFDHSDEHIDKLRQQADGMQAQCAGGMAGMMRLPHGPAELMLRLLSRIVEDFLDLRKHLGHQLDIWQRQLMNPRGDFDRWDALLRTRQVLHYLDDCCEDQRNTLAAWMDTLEDWVASGDTPTRREREMLLVRCRDTMEHVDRMAHHVQRLEQSAETAVQIHFNIQGNRTNDIMRMLTAVTAVFLPMGLIADLFGMGVAAMPWLHSAKGFWLTLMAMLVIAIGLLLFFMRKHYLSASDAGQREPAP